MCQGGYQVLWRPGNLGEALQRWLLLAECSRMLFCLTELWGSSNPSHKGLKRSCALVEVLVPAQSPCSGQAFPRSARAKLQRAL